MTGGTIRVGTSGWHYAHWKGTFYPEAMDSGDYLPYYAARFGTVEVNNTFYRLPETSTLAAWRDAVPDSFLFAVKASRYITHMKKLRDPEEPLANVLGRVAVLGDKLGPVLFQLPPNWGYNGERLARFLEALPEGHRYAFEFRNASWFNEHAYDLLAARGAAFCIYDMPNVTAPLHLTADLVYVRMHGSTHRYGGGYSDEALSTWAGRIAAWADEGRDVYCFFNNDMAGNAVRDARTLREMIDRAHPAGARPSA